MIDRIEAKAGRDYPGVCVAFFCHDGHGNLLWQLRSKNCRNEQGKWDVGAGGVKHGERIHEAVRRELREEYGVEAIEIQRLGMREEVFDGNHWIAFDWLVRVDRDQVRICEPEMVDAIEWIPIEHGLPAPVHAAVPKAFQAYKRQLVDLAMQVRGYESEMAP